MNNPNTTPLPPLNSLLKPEQLAKVPNLDETARAKYVTGVTGLWDKIQSYSEESAEHQNARRKLADVTSRMLEHMKKSALQSSANGNRPVSQGQPAQQDSRPQFQQPPQPGQPSQQPRPDQLAFSPNVIRMVQQLQLIIPPPVAAQGPEHAQTWLREAKQRYAQNLQKLETASKNHQDLQQQVIQRQQGGRSLTEQEKQQVNAKEKQLEGVMSQAKEYLTKFRQQQDQVKQAQSQSGNGAIAQANGLDAQDVTMGGMEGAAVSQPNRQQPQGPAHTVSSALDAARQQASSAARTAVSPTNEQTNHQGSNQGSEPALKEEPQSSQPSLDLSTSSATTMQHHNSPQVGQPPSQQAPTSQGPHALSHRAAMAQAAQSYSSQPGYQQTTPQSSTHGHPQIPNRADPPNNNVKMPIPKELKVGPPQAVSMGPARPTLTGGTSTGAIGQLGQAAIQKHPGYVLEGEGERVLSKKKLQELVRQVTGAGEDDDGELLTPDVEEVSVIISRDTIIVGPTFSVFPLLPLQLISTRRFSKWPTILWTTLSYRPAALRSSAKALS